MTAEVETIADNEELSIAEAALEFGVSATLIRKALREQRLTSVPHRWGRRVRRAEVAEFVRTIPKVQSLPATAGASPSRLPTYSRPSRAESNAERERLILAAVAERGQASASRIHQWLIEQGSASIPYVSVATTVTRLVQQGRLGYLRQSGRYVYHLPDGAAAAANPQKGEPPTPPSSAPPAPQLAAPVSYVHEELSATETATLNALRALGQAVTLDQLHQALRPRPTYVEVVQAVRRLRQFRLVRRISDGRHYLYAVV